jgi:hypothetical protein
MRTIFIAGADPHKTECLKALRKEQPNRRFVVAQDSGVGVHKRGNLIEIPILYPKRSAIQRWIAKLREQYPTVRVSEFVFCAPVLERGGETLKKTKRSLDESLIEPILMIQALEPILAPRAVVKFLLAHPGDLSVFTEHTMVPAALLRAYADLLPHIMREKNNIHVECVLSPHLS